MAIKTQSEWVLGRKQTPTSREAGNVVAQRFEVTAGELASSDIVELAVLPAHHTIVDAILDMDALDAGITADVGIMSGTVGDPDNARTCGSELFSAVDASSAVFSRVDARSAVTIAPKDSDRSIGVKVSGSVAAGKKIALTLFMAQ